MSTTAREPVAGAADDTDDDRVSTWIKVLVLAFLALFLFVGFSAFEAWPFTGWRLYSRARTSTEISVRPFVVQPDGTERPVVYDELPVAYRHAKVLLLPNSGVNRHAVCEALAEGERREDREVDAMRIYEVKEHLEIVEDEPTTKLERELLFTCAETGER